MENRIHRGNVWMVDLSSQYWMALLTDVVMVELVIGGLIWRSMGFTL